jgi:hypothetical protein
MVVWIEVQAVPLISSPFQVCRSNKPREERGLFICTKSSPSARLERKPSQCPPTFYNENKEKELMYGKRTDVSDTSL